MPGRPIQKRYRFRLRSLFVLTTIVAVFVWLASFEAGRILLFAALVFSGCIGFLCVIAAIMSFLLGTPGERQRKSRAVAENRDTKENEASFDDEELNDFPK